MDIATQECHEADAYGKERSEAQAHVVMIDCQCDLTMAPPVALRALACEFGGRLGHAGAPMARPAGTQSVHAEFAGSVGLDHVSRRTPGNRRDDKAQIERQ